jgi:peptidoglycan/LPS O-acetylase OafA/YrhL
VPPLSRPASSPELAARPQKQTYRPEIDGLRAVAVVPVILFHAGFPWFRGGFVGVDVFFVISGYLISQVILTDLRAGRFSLAAFYERRARRILPALFCIIAVCWPFAWAWMTPDQLSLFGQSVAAVSLFGSNVLFAGMTGYFAPAVEQFPLLHTWSLGVEEQFYVVFPLVVVLAWRGGIHRIAWITACVAVGSLALGEWGIRHDPSATFFLAPPRAWELMIGALFAFATPDASLSDRVGRRMSNVLSLLGMLMISAAIRFYSVATPFPGHHALLPTVGTALVLAFAYPNTVIGRILGLRMLVGLGLISYSAYLWHHPLFAFARVVTVGTVPTSVLGILALFTLPLAALTWRYVERPFRVKGYFTRTQIFSMSAVGSALFAGMGVYTYRIGGLDLLTYARRPNYGLSSACDFNSDFRAIPQCATSPAPRVMVWGDSYAMHIIPGLVADDGSIALVQATRSSCGPLLGAALISKSPNTIIGQNARYCVRFNNSVLDYLKQQRSIDVVVLASRFNQYVDGRAFDIATAGGVVAASPETAAEGMRSTIAELRRIGKRVVVVAPPPSGGFDIGACATRRALGKPVYGAARNCEIDRGVYARQNEGVIRLLDMMATEVPVVRFDSVLCRGSKCATSLAGVSLYRDDAHLSYAGSAYLGRMMGLAREIGRVAR